MQRSKGVLSPEEHFTMICDIYTIFTGVPYMPSAADTMPQQVCSHSCIGSSGILVCEQIHSCV